MTDTTEAEPTPAGESPNNGSLATPISSASINNIPDNGQIVNEADGKMDLDGKAHLAESGEAVESLQIESLGNGNITYKVGEKTVDNEDIEYATEQEAMLHDVMSKSRTLNVRAANFMAQHIDPQNPKYINEAIDSYQAGWYGYDENKLDSFRMPLNHSHELDAYGKKAREEHDAKQKQAQNEARATRGSTLGEDSNFSTKKAEVYFVKDGKTARFDGKNTGVRDQKRTAAVRTAEFLSRLGIGGKYYFYESYVNGDGKRVYRNEAGNEVKAPNGFYKRSDGSIYIDLNAGEAGDGITLFTLPHELTHFIRQWSEKKFNILADFLIQEYGKTDKDMDARVKEKQDILAAVRGEDVSYDEAFEEVVADSMATMFTDGNLYEKLAKLKAKDNELFNKIKAFIDKILAKFRKVYAELTPDQKNAQDVRNMKGAFDRIQTAFAEALVEASANYQMAENNTTEDGGVMYEIREIGNTGRFYVQADRQVLTGDDASLWGKQIENYINEQIRKEQDIAIPTSDGHVLLLTGRSSYKLSDHAVTSIQNKIRVMLSEEEYALKGRAATHIDELIQVAKFDGYEEDFDGKHENDIGEDGFNYFEAYFRDFDGKYYRVPLSAAINESEETVYSIGKIRQRSFPAGRGSSSKKEALKKGRKASRDIIYTSESESQEVKTALQLAYEKALKQKSDDADGTKKSTTPDQAEVDTKTESVAPAVLKSERAGAESAKNGKKLLDNEVDGAVKYSSKTTERENRNYDKGRVQAGNPELTGINHEDPGNTIYGRGDRLDGRGSTKDKAWGDLTKKERGRILKTLEGAAPPILIIGGVTTD